MFCARALWMSAVERYCSHDWRVGRRCNSMLASNEWYSHLILDTCIHMVNSILVADVQASAVFAYSLRVQSPILNTCFALARSSQSTDSVNTEECSRAMGRTYSQALLRVTFSGPSSSHLLGPFSESPSRALLRVTFSGPSSSHLMNFV